MFCTERAVAPKLEDFLAKHKYVLLYQFCGLKTKVHMLKKYKNKMIEGLFTLTGQEVKLLNDKDEQWYVLLSLKPAIEYQLS